MSVISWGRLLWETRDEFDEAANTLLQQVTDDTIVVVVVTNAIDTVNIVPNGVAKRRRVDVCVSPHAETQANTRYHTVRLMQHSVTDRKVMADDPKFTENVELSD